MPLRYDLKKIANWESLYTEVDDPIMKWEESEPDENGTRFMKEVPTGETRKVYKLDARLESIIFLTMAVGMGDITDANAQEFWIRVDFLQKLEGPFLISTGDNGETQPAYFTFDDVIRFIGLHTNVGYESRDQWSIRYPEFIAHKGVVT